jgi:hypothetical protein
MSDNDWLRAAVEAKRHPTAAQAQPEPAPPSVTRMPQGVRGVPGSPTVPFPTGSTVDDAIRDFLNEPSRGGWRRFA